MECFYDVKIQAGRSRLLLLAFIRCHPHFNQTFDDPGVGWIRPFEPILDTRKGPENKIQLLQGWSLFDLSWAADGRALFAGGQSPLSSYVIARIEFDDIPASFSIWIDIIQCLLFVRRQTVVS
jgi:hypothetical protein